MQQMTDSMVELDPTLAFEQNQLVSFAADVRALSEWVQANAGTMPAGWRGSTIGADIVQLFVDNAEQFASMTRWLATGTTIDTALVKDYGEYVMNVRRFFGKAAVCVSVMRGDACERVQTGVELVEVPDPDAPAVPTIVVEKPVFEWKCDPVLAAGGTSS